MVSWSTDGWIFADLCAVPVVECGFRDWSKSMTPSLSGSLSARGDPQPLKAVSRLRNLSSLFQHQRNFRGFDSFIHSESRGRRNYSKQLKYIRYCALYKRRKASFCAAESHGKLPLTLQKLHPLPKDIGFFSYSSH
jgi:hypothetical protein